MATPEQPLMTTTQRFEMTLQINRLEDAGMDVRELRASLAKLRMPDDTITVSLSYGDAVLFAAQLRTMVKLFGDHIHADGKALLERLAAVLLEAEVKS